MSRAKSIINKFTVDKVDEAFNAKKAAKDYQGAAQLIWDATDPIENIFEDMGDAVSRQFMDMIMSASKLLKKYEA